MTTSTRPAAAAAAGPANGARAALVVAIALGAVGCAGGASSASSAGTQRPAVTAVTEQSTEPAATATASPSASVGPESTPPVTTPPTSPRPATTAPTAGVAPGGGPATPTGTPSPLPPDAYDAVPGLTGTTETGYLTHVGTGPRATLTYNRVTFHWCTPAERDANPGCPDDYRITDDNPRLRTLPISPAATLLVLRPGARTATRLDLTQFAAQAHQSQLVDLRVDASGTVTGAGLPYTP